jgi:hypothetical protein
MTDVVVIERVDGTDLSLVPTVQPTVTPTQSVETAFVCTTALTNAAITGFVQCNNGIIISSASTFFPNYDHQPTGVIASTLNGMINYNGFIGTGSSYFITNSTNTVYCNQWWVEQTDEERIAQEERNRQFRKQQEIKRAASVHRAKGAIKRALKLMEGVGMGNDVKVFLGGGTIEISHPDSLLKFLITKSRYYGIIDKTISPGCSVPFKLQLYTKTDVHVADLCAFFDDTPILDQIMAVTLFVKSGDESALLKTANWSRLTNDEDVVLDLAVWSPECEKKLRLERFDNPANIVGSPGQFIQNVQMGLVT